MSYSYCMKTMVLCNSFTDFWKLRLYTRTLPTYRYTYSVVHYIVIQPICEHQRHSSKSSLYYTQAKYLNVDCRLVCTIYLHWFKHECLLYTTHINSLYVITPHMPALCMWCLWYLVFTHDCCGCWLHLPLSPCQNITFSLRARMRSYFLCFAGWVRSVGCST